MTLHTCCVSAVIYRAVFPWQWILKRVPQVEEGPSDDHIVVESHKEAHLRETDQSNIYVYTVHLFRYAIKCVV